MVSADRVGREVLASGLGAAATDTLFLPLDIIKLRLQLQGATKGPMSGQILPALPSNYERDARKRAMLLMDPGDHAAAIPYWPGRLRIGLYSSVKQKVQDVICPGSSEVGFAAKVISGAGTGALGSAISNPIDVVRTRLQADSAPVGPDGRYASGLAAGKVPRYTGTLQAFGEVYRAEGFRKGLYRGTSATMARAICLSGAQLSTYDQLKLTIKAAGHMEEGTPLHLLSAFLSAIVAQTVAMPADTLKTRVLNSTSPRATLLSVLAETLRGEGVRALFKGYLPAVMRQGPVIVVQMPIVEQLRALLGVGYM